MAEKLDREDPPRPKDGDFPNKYMRLSASNEAGPADINIVRDES